MAEEEGLKYLVDTSALYPLLKRLGKTLYEHLEKLSVLDLTKYELGNVIWVEVRRGLIEDWLPTIKAWADVIKELKEVKIEDIVNVERLTVKLDITFYDASYIFTAKHMSLTLITEDLEMREKAFSVEVETISTDEFIKLIKA